MGRVYTRPSKEMRRTEGLEFVRAATVIVGFSDTCDFICNGVADQVEINAALTYVNALGGGKVQLLRRIYNILANLVMFDNIFMVGMGISTILFVPNGTDIDLDVIYGNQADNVVLKDFKIDGNKANQGAGTMNGVDAIECTEWIMENLYIVNMLDRGIITFHAVDLDSYHIINKCTIKDCDATGINITRSSFCMISNCTSKNNTVGIANPGPSYDVSIVGCQCELNSQDGIQTNGWATITACTLQDNVRDGIRVASGGIVAIVGNDIRGNQQGIMLIGNECTLTGNVIQVNDQHGVYISGVNNNIISSNIIKDNSVQTNNTFSGIFLDGDADDNFIIGNQIFQSIYQQQYGINISVVTCNGTYVGKNILSPNQTASINDAGTDTKLATYPMKFIQGTTFISADGSAKGWEIDAEADMAVALEQLPLEVQQVVRLKIWAVALGAPVGAGGQMHLDVMFNAGASGEAWNLAANSWTLANFDGEEADYANTEIIHWVIEDGDVGNELRNLLGGDSLEAKINGGTADDPDGATNATFRIIEIEYV